LIQSLTLLLIMGISLSMAPSTAILAQADEPDIEAIGELVTDADPDDLLAALETPIDDSDLPEGFLEASFIDPDDTSGTPAPTVLSASDLEGSLGNTAWDVVPDEDVFDGETFASVQFVSFDPEDFTDDFLDSFIEGAAGSIEGQEGASAEKVEFAGVDAALISFDVESAAANAYVRYLAVPVGTMFVFVNVSAQTEDLDGDDIMAATEELTLASITYLETVLEDL
jgi:hypothetical protein